MFSFFRSQRKEGILYDEYRNALAKNDKSAAAYLIERVIELDPSNKGARFERGKLLAEIAQSAQPNSDVSSETKTSDLT